MGCQGSVPDRDPKINIGKTEQVPRTGLSGNVMKRKSPMDMIRNSEDTIIGSSASKATSSIASMDFDEYVTNDRPKLDHNGHLMPEEVIRRTSSSPSSSVILLGDKKKCGREVHVTVSVYLGGDSPAKKHYERILTIHLFLLFTYSMPIDHSAATIQRVSLGDVLARAA